MPADYDAEYCSPMGGAYWLPVSEEESEEAKWERATWEEMYLLAKEKPEAGVWLQGTLFGPV
ncbi:hypothetical protein FGG08_007138 [Glutinoglossum americanum]|uniref:Uncharacterized protein n=1 Tax=Glutinoglossum americanum TaxID=1670608 RepID=A0A9P8HUW1_9PEZI|nr:hypothetical protein FGG08_007138 [Glutinoglossum americanum]